MASMTLLEIVQDVMSDLSDDDVSTWNETIESAQVAQIVESTYFELMNSNLWKHQRGFVQPTETDASTPTHMTIPSRCKEIVQISYNSMISGSSRSYYDKIPYVSPDEFLEAVDAYDNTATNVDEITDFSGVKFNVKNDTAPTCWTSFDNTYIVMNAYNSDVDSYLETANVRAIGYTSPAAWTLADALTPDMPDELFPLLVAEAKSTASLRLKQVADQKAEQQAERQMEWAVQRLADDPMYREVVVDKAATEIAQRNYRRFTEVRDDFHTERSLASPPRKLAYGRRRFK